MRQLHYISQEDIAIHKSENEFVGSYYHPEGMALKNTHLTE